LNKRILAVIVGVILISLMLPAIVLAADGAPWSSGKGTFTGASFTSGTGKFDGVVWTGAKGTFTGAAFSSGTVKSDGAPWTEGKGTFTGAPWNTK
jgi:hypothetical protein